MIMNRIKRIAPITVGITGVMCLTFAVGSAFAASSTTGTSKKNSAALTQVQQTDLTTLKTKGSAEINRRIDSLNSATSKINTTTKLSSSDKAYLQNEVATEISGLTSLESTLNGETTLSAARTDVQSIFSDYRVYALLLPKVRLIVAADGEIATSDKLTTLATQLQSQITTDQNAGKNVSQLQADLTDMQTQANNAQSIANSIESKVLTLQPTDYNSDHTILSGDLAQLKTAHADNQAAYNDAKKINSGLKSL